ncbi:MAG TPA: hypothetical protein VES03_07365 [Motilibacterales bacterium]|nr:hypothetical protein [Motilibacterales bacterium]
MGDQVADESQAGWRDWLVVIVLSVTTILAAWSAFQASKWSGMMSISFSQASSARIEASRLDGDADRVASIQVGLFSQWVRAFADGSQREIEYLQSVFPEPLATAFRAWEAADPQANADVPRTPFAMPEYQIPAEAEAAAADARADAKFTDALAFNQRSDNYTVLTVLFAAVLFFASLTGRARRRTIQNTFLGMALVLLIAASAFLISFPKLV